MIKFFRLIRLSYIKQNEMGKYFKYAIGEILLVVIGILIALQINNWNQNRINHIKAIEYHKRLIQDLDGVIQRATEMNERAQTVLEAVTKSVNALEKGQNLTPTEREDLDFAIIWMYRFNYQVPNISTIEEMKSNGQLSLIYDPDLRKSTLSYSGFLESIEAIFNYLGQSIHNSLQYLDKNLRSKVNTETLVVSHEYDVETLASDEEFINKFSRVSVHWRANVFFTSRLLNQAIDLKEKYENELKKIQ